MSIKKKIMTVTVGSVLVMGLLSIFFVLTMVRNNILVEIQESLKGTAAATLAAYDQNTGDYMQNASGDIWKGSYNISKSESLVDRIKKNTGMDVTFFYGDKRIMTSALDENGNRILGSAAGTKIVDKVLLGGEEYFSRAVSVDGVMEYGYFIPVYQNGSTEEIVGMVFVGTNKQQKDASINQILFSIGFSICIVMLLCIGISMKLALSISNNIRNSIEVMRKVSEGNLDVWVDEKLLHKKDEIGDLSRVTITLRDAMRKVIREISENAKSLQEAAELLGDAAENTNGTMGRVRGAVQTIVENSTQQAQYSENTADHMKIMGENITETASEAETLDENACVMQQSSEKAAQTLDKLRKINREVEQIIGEVQTQTNRTNDSVGKIHKATAYISDIAEETNLLSLNASIEAAKAGNNGNGFGVVAEQIKKLSEQSNESSREIEETTEILSTDSARAVEMMQKMQEIITSQSESMRDTQEVVEEVLKQIENSMRSIRQIRESTKLLADSRNQVLDAVGELSEIAQGNVTGTKKTYEETQEVAETFHQVAASAERLEEISRQLVQGIEYFKM